MCRRPSQPRRPSDSQLLSGNAAGSAAAAAEASASTQETETWTTTATTAAMNTAATPNPVVDLLTLADAILLSRRGDNDSNVSAARTSNPPALRSQMTEEQRNEIRQMEWERFHPVMGVLRDDEDGDADNDQVVPTDPRGESSSSAGRRRPRRASRGPQGRRLSVETHPLKLLEDMGMGMGMGLPSIANDVESDASGPNVRSGRRRVRRAKRSASEEGSTASTIAAIRPTNATLAKQ